MGLFGNFVVKRLLRNRVSAQQARERKKAYLSELENRVKDLENKNSELEERLSTLQNENQMLRHVRFVDLTVDLTCNVNAFAICFLIYHSTGLSHLRV